MLTTICMDDCIRLFTAVGETWPDAFVGELDPDIRLYVGPRRAWDLKSRVDAFVYPWTAPGERILPIEPEQHPALGEVVFQGQLFGMRVYAGVGLPELTAIVEHEDRRLEIPWRQE